jgi:hypothetical protein
MAWQGPVGSQIQQWWDQTGGHNDVYTKCGEKMDVVARSIGIPLKPNNKWDQSGSGHFCPCVVICGMSNFIEIEFGWNHVLVWTTICCSELKIKLTSIIILRPPIRK